MFARSSRISFEVQFFPNLEFSSRLRKRVWTLKLEPLDSKIFSYDLFKGVPLLIPISGLITYGDGFVGFVIEKIPARFASLDPVSEGSAGEIPSFLKKKWAAQIEHTVTQLHKNDVIWRDAKPGNVIIDKDDNAWLIDFGGGFTELRVDRELYESREGDLQALGRIKDKLGKE